MTLFEMSYSLMWVLIALQTYFLIQMSKKLSRIILQPSNPNYGHRLIREDHGIPSGEKFPILQFESVNNGRLDLARTNKKGLLVAFTAIGCDACKELYPVFENFHKLNPQFQLLLITVGEERDVVANMNSFNLTVPTAAVSSTSMFHTSIYPFVYYISPDGIVISKSVVQLTEQLQALIQRGTIPKAS